MIDHDRMIHHGERLMTLFKRATVSDDRDARRDEFVAEFGHACTEAGMIAERKWATDWSRVQMMAVDFHTAACHALERRSGTFAHAGAEMALVSTLRGLAGALGYALSDAATAQADEHDEAAMAAVEMRREAAE